MGYNELAFAVLGALCVAVAYGLRGRLPWAGERLLVLGVLFRVIGSTVRYEILFNFYKGFGDALLYYVNGLQIARSFGADLNPFTLAYWAPGPSWWGTPFLTKLSGVVLAFVGPTMRGEFLVFALISFLGLVLIAKAFHAVQPGSQALLFTGWLWLWPSLWFWPASVGKEAIILLAVGLVTYGHAGVHRLLGPLALAAGVGLAFCIRPHVAAALGAASLVAYWVGSWERFTLRRLAETVLAVALAVFAFRGMLSQFGLDAADVEGIVDYVSWRSGQTLDGGSQIAQVSLSPAGVVVGLVNVWLRPFPWDVHNLTSAFAAAEVLVFAWLLVRRRRQIWTALRHWRRHPLLRFALPFALLYSVMIGLTFANLGIIARQRSPIFPFVFMVLLAVPERQPARRTAPLPSARPVAGDGHAVARS